MTKKDIIYANRQLVYYFIEIITIFIEMFRPFDKAVEELKNRNLFKTICSFLLTNNKTKKRKVRQLVHHFEEVASGRQNKPGELKQNLTELVAYLKEYYTENAINSEESQFYCKIAYCIKVLKIKDDRYRKLLEIVFLSIKYDLTDILFYTNFSDNYKFINKKLICKLLGLMENEHDTFFSQTHILFSTQLIIPDFGLDRTSFSKLNLFRPFYEAITDQRVSVHNTFSYFFSGKSARSLPIKAFSHLERETAMLSCILPSTLEKNRKPANILLYGRAGMGKTEYAKSLLRELGLQPLFIKNAMMKSNDIFLEVNIESKDRLGFYHLAQKVLQDEKDVCIVVDEADDILNIDLLSKINKAQLINDLENNNIPCIWIINSIDFIPESIRRRFDYSIPFNNMERSVIESIFKKEVHRNKLPGLAQKKILSYILNEELSPGQFIPALRYAGLAYNNGQIEEGGINRFVNDMLAKSNKLIGRERTGGMETIEPKNATDYSTSLINTSLNPERFIEAIADHLACYKNDEETIDQGMNILFYGLPGTGKTALAQHIAASIGCPLIERSASDLLDPFVGMTERRLREAFQKADEKKGILLIDEVDTFLSDRRNTSKSWEVSRVNEMLHNMEHFKGVFISTSNNIDYFDRAALRRFPLKIEFLPLSTEQKIKALKMYFPEQTAHLKDSELGKHISSIDPLMIGDFKVVRSRMAFMKDCNLEKIVGALADEVRLKGYDSQRKIGFFGP